jgi:hypothetical protein
MYRGNNKGCILRREEELMDAWHELNVRLQMEALISEREGMIAENKQREYMNESMAYSKGAFENNARELTFLLEELRKYG